MKVIAICLALATMSCCGNKVTKNNMTDFSKADSPLAIADTLPVCINEMIQQFAKEDVQNPPRKIFSYIYKGNMVYYVTAPCCDFFSDLYDKECNLIGHPDGGFTGRGDGKLSDFSKMKQDEKLIWEDKRGEASKK